MIADRARVSLPSLLLVLLALALSLGGCAALPGPTALDRSAEALVAVDRERAQAMVRVDRTALERLLDPELSYTHSTGAVDSRAKLVDDLVARRIDYLSIDSPSPRVRVHGSTAVVTGPVAMQVKVDDTVHPVRSVYTAVYVAGPEGWRLVAYQSTQAPEAEPGR